MRCRELYTVAFICTGNSARSILAEALLNRDGGGRFQAYSAGSFPAGEINFYALELLSALNVATDGLQSKSWDELSAPGKPNLDFVFTVCDHAAAESCPIWPGHPVTAHWGLADPARVEGSAREKRRAFREAYRIIQRRISLFISLPLESLDCACRTKKMAEVGRA